jgi:hypothetical protein
MTTADCARPEPTQELPAMRSNIVPLPYPKWEPGLESVHAWTKA